MVARKLDGLIEKKNHTHKLIILLHMLIVSLFVQHYHSVAHKH